MYETISNDKKLGYTPEICSLLFEHTANPIFILDVQGTFIEVNQAACEHVGYRRDELLQMRPEHIEDAASREKIPGRMAQLVCDRQAVFEAVHVHRNGKPIPVEMHISLIEHDGRMLAFNICRDISQRKHYEEELKLAASVFNASSAAIVVTDPVNRIISVNPAFTAITGYEPHEVIGRNPSILSSGKQSKAFYREMWQRLERDQHWHGELWNRRKDGQLYAEQLTLNVVVNKDGSVHRYIAIFSDISERKQAEDMMWRQANYDTVTNLPNRRLFLDRLVQEIKKCRRATSSLALFFIDLDRFKEVNDTHGHDIGDRLLIEAARRLSDCVRSTDTVARLGGDEFTVILTDLVDTARVETVAKNMRDALEQPFSIDEKTLQISGSIGIALYPDDATHADDLVVKADIAMYASKRQGRNRFCFYSSDLET